MPGTLDEYMADSSTDEAEQILDDLISEDSSGLEIIKALETAGLRIYNTADIEEYDGEEDDSGTGELGMEASPAMPEEEEVEEEGDEYEGGPMYDEELADSGPGPSMAGGNENGNRDLIIEAVRFGIDEDKKKKSKSDKSE